MLGLGFEVGLELKCESRLVLSVELSPVDFLVKKEVI